MTSKQGTEDALHPDPRVWIEDLDLNSSEEWEVPDRLIDQVIGQDEAVEIALKAAKQSRNLMLIGDPGTGKSMIAKAMAEVLPDIQRQDVVLHPNEEDENNPNVTQVEAGMGERILAKQRRSAKKRVLAYKAFEWIVGVGTIAFGLALWLALGEGILAFLFAVLIAILFLYFTSQNRPTAETMVPKLLLANEAEPESAPFVDATGSQAGALLGDVRHDPYQSGGLETPAHHRVEAGAIHRAHKGLLFIDEINTLRLDSQQSLLTAMQERAFAISGQSESSSGAMIRTNPVPCDFILVAAGNLDAVQPPDPIAGVGMHPALRSRIRGYGYEVYVNTEMDDTEENRRKLIQFISQEVQRDGKIPHFDRGAIAEVVREAQRRSGRSGKLTLRLRELGGLVRTAGDYAITEGVERVRAEHVLQAKQSARSLEQQIMEDEIQDSQQRHETQAPSAAREGTCAGVGLVETNEGEVAEPAGIVVPVEAAVVPALSRQGGSIVAGDSLERMEGASVDNVSAVLKSLKGRDLAQHDIHVDATLDHPEATAEGVGAAAALAAISALEEVPVDPTTAVAGEIGVDGRLKATPSTLQRVETAVARGYVTVVVPAGLKDQLVLEEDIEQAAEIHYCSTLAEALELALDGSAEDRDDVVERLKAAPSNGKAAEAKPAEK